MNHQIVLLSMVANGMGKKNLNYNAGHLFFSECIWPLQFCCCWQSQWIWVFLTTMTVVCVNLSTCMLQLPGNKYVLRDKYDVIILKTFLSSIKYLPLCELNCDAFKISPSIVFHICVYNCVGYLFLISWVVTSAVLEVQNN